MLEVSLCGIQASSMRAACTEVEVAAAACTAPWEDHSWLAVSSECVCLVGVGTASWAAVGADRSSAAAAKKIQILLHKINDITKSTFMPNRARFVPNQGYSILN